MQIELKSNRKFIYKMCAPFAILLAICSVLLIIEIVIDAFETQLELQNNIIILIVGLFVETCLITMILFCKFYKGKSYKFTEQEIVIYKHGKQIDTIRIEDIEGIHYYSFKWRYIITIFAGALNEGGCWKLHVWLGDGTKKELGFFSKKDVKMLQEKLYKDLILIY